MKKISLVFLALFVSIMVYSQGYLIRNDSLIFQSKIPINFSNTISQNGVAVGSSSLNLTTNGTVTTIDVEGTGSSTNDVMVSGTFLNLIKVRGSNASMHTYDCTITTQKTYAGGTITSY